MFCYVLTFLFVQLFAQTLELVALCTYCYGVQAPVECDLLVFKKHRERQKCSVCLNLRRWLVWECMKKGDQVPFTSPQSCPVDWLSKISFQSCERAVNKKWMRTQRRHVLIWILPTVSLAVQDNPVTRFNFLSLAGKWEWGSHKLHQLLSLPFFLPSIYFVFTAVLFSLVNVLQFERM